MDTEGRINQFKTMTLSDPDNELGHFSLARAYLDAGLYAEAEPSLVRVLELNPQHSKSYQLLGVTLKELGRRDDAVNILKQGYEIATKSGDTMPRNGIAEILEELGAPVPQVAPVAAPEAPSDAPSPAGGGFQCSRCGRPDNQLDARPFKGALGERVLASVCKGCWQEWIPMGTKVINELGLALADPRAQDAYDEHMKEFLQLHD